MSQKHSGIGCIQDDQLVEAMRHDRSGRPCDDAAPVVADQVKPLEAERVGKGYDITDQLAEVYSLILLGLSLLL